MSSPKLGHLPKTSSPNAIALGVRAPTHGCEGTRFSLSTGVTDVGRGCWAGEPGQRREHRPWAWGQCSPASTPWLPVRCPWKHRGPGSCRLSWLHWGSRGAQGLPPDSSETEPFLEGWDWPHDKASSAENVSRKIVLLGLHFCRVQREVWTVPLVQSPALLFNLKVRSSKAINTHRYIPVDTVQWNQYLGYFRRNITSFFSLIDLYWQLLFKYRWCQLGIRNVTEAKTHLQEVN